MPRVLSVGQCGYDHASIARHLLTGFGADVVGANTFAEALAAMRAGPFDLVLVNRVTDRDGSQGVDLIRAIKADAALSAVPVMLVSNYESAQTEAVGLGALPGFGKADLGRQKGQAALARVFAPEPAP
jgi:two-component system chemotaxis response regulator CheY